MFRLKLARVAGESMLPAISPDDYVIAWRNPWSRIQPGRLVICQHPQYGAIVKRIAAVDQDKALLEGDNREASVASARMGWVDQADLSPVIYVVKANTRNRRPSY